MAQQANYLLLLLLVHHNLQSVSRSPTNSASAFASVTGMSIFGTVAVQGCTGMTVGAKLNIVSTRELNIIVAPPPPQMGAFSKISLDNKKSGRINAKICYLGNKASHVHSIFVAQLCAVSACDKPGRNLEIYIMLCRYIILVCSWLQW